LDIIRKYADPNEDIAEDLGVSLMTVSKGLRPGLERQPVGASSGAPRS